MFPLGTVLFPELPLLLHVFEPRYRALVRDSLESDHEFGVVLITRGSEVGGGDQRASVGTVARIEGARPLPDGRWVLATRGRQRINVLRWLPEDPYPCAMVRTDAERHLPNPARNPRRPGRRTSNAPGARCGGAEPFSRSSAGALPRPPTWPWTRSPCRRHGSCVASRR